MSLIVRLGIVAHTARSEAAHELMEQVGAAFMAVDDGSRGATGNHRHVWHQLLKRHPDTDWLVVLEDDALPVPGFTEQLKQALQHAPSDIVSLYLGHPEWLHWWPTLQRDITAAGEQADRSNASWILTNHTMHGVATAIRTNQVQNMLNHTLDSLKPFDYAVRQWARDTGRYIAFSLPSLVQHADLEPVIKPCDRTDRRPRTTPRRAWRTGTNTWTSKAVTL